MKSTKLIIYGKVQNVYLRKNIFLKATSLGLAGYVKNNPNGISVECLIQGNKRAINLLVEYIKSNPGSALVEKIKTEETEEKNKGFFEIIY